MKYAFLVLSFLFLFPVANATLITSFNDSEAVITIAQFMNDVREDLPNAVTLSDKKINIKDASKCAIVSADEVLGETLKGIKKVLRFYPDEELPLEEAIADLVSYLGTKTYHRCLLEKTTKDHVIKTVYFFDQKDKIHLRMDNWTLLIAGQ